MIRPSRITRIMLLLLAAIPLVGGRAKAEPAVPNTTFAGHQSPALALTFSPDDKLLAGAADDGALQVWNVESKEETFSCKGLRANHNDLRFTPDSKRLVALGDNNDVIVIELKAGETPRSIAITDLPGGPTALDLSPDGKTVAVVGRGALRLYDVATGASKKQFVVHPDHGVSAVAYSHDGARIATAGSDHLALLLETATGKTIGQFDLTLPGEAVAFSHDGKTLIAYAERVVRSFDIQSGKMQKLVDKGYEFRTMTVTPDGKSILLGGAGHGPWLVSLADGTLTDDAYNADDRINCAAISPSGKWLAGGGNQGPFYVWKLAH